MELTHFDENGNARMVDVSDKDKTSRTAVAEGFITLSREAFDAVTNKTISKGDVLTVAQTAGIMACKK
ncbi:MAG: cyclic pyranopterin monophosphate synthase MoaC, partial [Erysipelotrichaceae bacterium]|nr:cyclic pyranopterin monophosphate synthase MoaC [Erysipelotrichaceae bacterium]